MKLIIILAVIVGPVLGGMYLPYYWTENDYLDVDAVIADLSELHAYTDCFLDKGPCSPTAWSFRVILQDTVYYACDRCNVPQKQQYGRYLLGLKLKLPEDYLRFRQKYDPQNVYFDALEAELSKFWNYTTRAKSPVG